LRSPVRLASVREINRNRRPSARVRSTTRPTPPPTFEITRRDSLASTRAPSSVRPESVG
jgi:hypothetical protein